MICGSEWLSDCATWEGMTFWPIATSRNARASGALKNGLDEISVDRPGRERLGNILVPLWPLLLPNALARDA
jgi:hypothetical protein